VNKELEIPANRLIPHKKGESFVQTITEFLDRGLTLVRKKIDSDHLSEYLHELGSLHGEAVSFLYATRKYRNKALKAGYEMYPKGKCNSEEQIALVRAYADEEYNLHSLVKDLTECIKSRQSAVQSDMKHQGIE
jgi:hypothetical protein